MTEDLAIEMSALNRHFLNIADGHLRALRRLLDDENGNREFLNRLVAKLEQSKSDGTRSPSEALESCMELIREEAQRIREKQGFRL